MRPSTIIYFLLIGAFIAFFIYLGNRPKPATPPVAAATQATPLPPPPPAAPAAAPSRPAPQAPAQLDSEKIQALARQARVEILRFERQGMTGTLEVQWVSDVVTQGTDFCDRLRTEGIIRMYDLGATPLRPVQTQDGRRAYVSQFKITF